MSLTCLLLRRLRCRRIAATYQHSAARPLRPQPMPPLLLRFPPVNYLTGATRSIDWPTNQPLDPAAIGAIADKHLRKTIRPTDLSQLFFPRCSRLENGATPDKLAAPLPPGGNFDQQQKLSQKPGGPREIGRLAAQVRQGRQDDSLFIHRLIVIICRLTRPPWPRGRTSGKLNKHLNNLRRPSRTSQPISAKS